MNIVGCRPGIIVFLIMTPYRFPHYDTLSFNRHSEQWQKCLVGKTGNRMVTRSEESITALSPLDS
ncbi:MAG TPA: hypothetical protein DGO70_00020 [Dialister sp.]|nr:hypothetical protein [Dialister sp.]HCW01677.1 hypothetical protein [Dialister sp.]